MRRLLVAVALLAFVAPSSAGAFTPNDPAWSQQWGLQRMRVDKVWDWTTGSPSVVIASVDTGVNVDLPDLQGAFAPGWDFTDNDDQIADVHGHGTLVAGEMVARANNGIAIAGICPECRVMPVRVTAREDGMASDADVAQGIRWAVDHGARIVNVGIVHGETPPADSTLADAVQYATDHDALVVTSAGNTGADRPVYPGYLPNVLAVSATDPRDLLIDYATRGDWVKLAAFGTGAFLSIFDTWGFQEGTSFSAPAVSATAALALSLKPMLSAAAIRQALVDTAVPVPGIGGGRVDAYAALVRLGAITPGKPPPVTGTRDSRIVFGTVRRLAHVRLNVGRGRLSLVLTVKTPKPKPRIVRGKRVPPKKTPPECNLSGIFDGDILSGVNRGAKGVALTAQVPAGRYVVDIVCRTSKVKRYSLSIDSILPRGASGSIGG